jgi:hypothetical protein
MNTLIRINYGDCSGDGHRIAGSSLIRSNKTIANLNEAYQKGSNIIGFDFKDTVAIDYEDNDLPYKEAKILQDFDFDLTVLDDYNEDLDDITLMREEYVDLYLKICQLGDPDFLYEYTRMSEIDIGGYGLFWV